MIRFLLVITLFLSLVQAESKRYYIQLGSFQQLNMLEKTINSMPEALRSHIIVVNSNGWMVPFAYNTTNYGALVQKLPEFQRFFPDAFINDSEYILRHRIVRNYTGKVIETKPQVINPARIYTVPQPTYRAPKQPQNVAISEEDYINAAPTYTPPSQMDYPVVETEPVAQAVVIPKPTVAAEATSIKMNYFTKEMLSGKQFFLAYKATKNNPNLLIKVQFSNYQVTYQPIIGDMKLADANYFVDEKKLYMYTDNFTQDGAYSKIEEHRDDHILVSSWSGGKKLNTLRYYYKLEDAKAYLGEESSKDELSKILEEQNSFSWKVEEN